MSTEQDYFSVLIDKCVSELKSCFVAIEPLPSPKDEADAGRSTPWPVVWFPDSTCVRFKVCLPEDEQNPDELLFHSAGGLYCEVYVLSDLQDSWIVAVRVDRTASRLAHDIIQYLTFDRTDIKGRPT
jgi:hypothetical protein